MQVTIEKLDRGALIDWYRRNRARSAEIFALIVPRSSTTRPIPLRHPFMFYEGHIPAFSFLTLNERGPRSGRSIQRFERSSSAASIPVRSTTPATRSAPIGRRATKVQPFRPRL